jgi:hypothetical protein
MGPSVSSSKAATFINCRHRGIQKRESVHFDTVFSCSPTSQNFRFPADKCMAPNQPTVPSSIVKISPSWVTFLDVILGAISLNIRYSHPFSEISGLRFLCNGMSLNVGWIIMH